MEMMDLTPDPYFLDGHGSYKSHALLMIHGFTSTPAEHRRLSYFLNEQGFTINAVQLPGHGTTPQQMSLTGWIDWLNHVKASYLSMKEKGYERISAVGYSMGGLLGLMLAMEQSLHSLITLSAPVYLQNHKIVFAAMLHHLAQQVDRKKKDQPQFQATFNYTTTPLSCAFSLRKLMKRVKRSLDQVNIPIMISQGMEDAVVHPRSAQYIYHHVASSNKQLKLYPTSTHNILHDADHPVVYDDILHFLQHPSAKEDAEQVFRVY